MAQVEKRISYVDWEERGIFMKRESAEKIAREFLNKMNPSEWNGYGKQPKDFDSRIVTYSLTNDVELDISFEREEHPDTGKKEWSHYCELRVAGERDDLLECCHGYSVDSVEDLVGTILDVCEGYELVEEYEKIVMQQTLIDIGTMVYDYFQSAKDNLSHASDSHEASFGNGQCEIMEKLVGGIYNLINESINGKEVMEKIHAYEVKAEEFREKAGIIIEASDYELSLSYEDDEMFINEVIEELENNGIEITNDNFESIVAYVENKLNQEIDIKFFESQRELKVNELEAPEQNAVFLALYEKYKESGLKKEDILESMKGAMEDKVSNLEKIFCVEYLERERWKDPRYMKEIPQIVIPGSDLDVATYLNEKILKKSIAAVLEDGFFKVERLRGSVTQGEATVYCNGQKIVQYGDKICLRCKDGNWSDAMAMKEIPDSSLEAGEYGSEIGGYRSIKPDHQFVISAIRVYFKEINQAIMKDIRQVSLEEKIGKASEKVTGGFGVAKDKDLER